MADMEHGLAEPKTLRKRRKQTPQARENKRYPPLSATQTLASGPCVKRATMAFSVSLGFMALSVLALSTW